MVAKSFISRGSIGVETEGRPSLSFLCGRSWKTSRPRAGQGGCCPRIASRLPGDRFSAFWSGFAGRVGWTLPRLTPKEAAKSVASAGGWLATAGLSGGPQCPECRYRVHRDSASALGTVLGGLEVVLRAGSSQGGWGRGTACPVVLSGVVDPDKWLGAGMPDREVRTPSC